MILLIDGYNLLKKIVKAAYISDEQRQRFIQELHRYARLKGHTIMLVFDGGQFTKPTQERHGNVIIVYSGIYETADDYIKDYSNHHRNQDILIVSSDRELKRAADTYKLVWLDSHDFYNLLRTTLHEDTSGVLSPGKAHKLKRDSTLELDELMEKVQVTHIKDEESSTKRKRKSSTPSKKERTVLKKLKKL